MGLQYTGDVLAVTVDTVTPRPGDTWEAFQSIKIAAIDDGRITEMNAGRDLPADHLRKLRECPPMTRVVLDVFILKGKTYATSLVEVAAPAKAG